MEDPVPVKEEYIYQVGKIQFIVTPVYKDKGESMRDILLKLMMADVDEKMWNEGHREKI